MKQTISNLGYEREFKNMVSSMKQQSIGMYIEPGITSEGMSSITGFMLLDTKGEHSNRFKKGFKDRRFRNKKVRSEV